MLSNLPTLGIRFDIQKLDTQFGDMAYGRAAWLVFWRAIEPSMLGTATLYEGDTGLTLQRGEDCYCLAVQNVSQNTIEKIISRLRVSKQYLDVCAEPNFVREPAVFREPLPFSGFISSLGSILGQGDRQPSAHLVQGLEQATRERDSHTSQIQEVNVPDHSELERFRPVAKGAVTDGYLGPIALRDVYWFKIALFEEAEKKYGLKSDFELYKGVGEAFHLICAKCGVYTKDAMDSLSALSPDEVRSGKVSYLGPNVRSLAEGICPGCGTDVVEARFNRSLLDQRFAKEPFIIGKAHIFVEGGAPSELGLQILKALQPISIERNKDLTFWVHPVSPPWPQSHEEKMIVTHVTLRKYGVGLDNFDGNNEFQTGEALGKRFFALYLRKGAEAAGVQAIEKATPQSVAKSSALAPSPAIPAGGMRSVNEIAAAHRKSVEAPKRWWHFWR